MPTKQHHTLNNNKLTNLWRNFKWNCFRGTYLRVFICCFHSRIAFLVGARRARILLLFMWKHFVEILSLISPFHQYSKVHRWNRMHLMRCVFSVICWTRVGAKICIDFKPSSTHTRTHIRWFCIAWICYFLFSFGLYFSIRSVCTCKRYYILKNAPTT